MKVAFLCVLVFALDVPVTSLRLGEPSSDTKLDAKPEPKRAMESMERFKTSIQMIMQQHRYTTSKPIVVTAFDSWYNDIALRWVARSNELGVDQYIMVALDAASAKLADENGFPAVISSGELVSDEKAKLKWSLPEMLSAVKFLVPGLLMQEGFEDVIFSEMDVFFFQNPFDATKDSPGHFLAMDDCDCSRINIGFMEFRPREAMDKDSDQLATMTLDFANLMVSGTNAMTKVASDQKQFNKFVKKYKFFHTTFLDRGEFAVKGGHRTNSTKVAHFAFALPDCKMRRLIQLYNDPHSPVAAMVGTPEGEHPTWSEC